MQKIIKEEKSDYELIKSKINDIAIKNGLNSKNYIEPIILISPKEEDNNNKKEKLRPYSNFLPKYSKNNIKPTKVNNYNLLAIGFENRKKDFKIDKKSNILRNRKNLENSKILSMSEKEMNTKSTYNINKNSNQINLIDEFNLPDASSIKKEIDRNINNKINQEYYLFTSPIKRNKSNLTDKKNRNIYNNQINRYLSPRVYISSKNKKILTTEKTNRCVSPSTANNSNVNTNNNSYSSHFIFGNSFIANNIPKNLKNNSNNPKYNTFKNLNDNIILKNNNEGYNKKMTLIEYQLNQLLSKRQNKKNMKIKKIKKEKMKVLT